MASEYRPLDVHCATCKAQPGVRCRSVVIADRPYLRRPHAPRVTAARVASQRRAASQGSTVVSEAWTCPADGCGRSYWPAKEWEPELWPAVRRAAQELHRELHR